MSFKDQLNRNIYLKGIPKRIVSLVPSQTELLCDLGLESSIVGLTKFCVHPGHIKSKSTIAGGTKQIHIDRVRALEPDIILCNKEENTKEIVELCETICPVHVSDIYTLSDSLELITQYGVIFNAVQKALAICEEIKNESESFKAFVANKPELKAVYFIWKNPAMVAANHTFINHLLQLNKFDNFYNDRSRYPEISLEVNNEAELVLLSSEPFPFKEKHKKELKDFYPNAKIILADGEMFSWFGSRLTKAFQYFKALRSSL
nr:helical backbone metal receptor [Seonamhaeicola sp.]